MKTAILTRQSTSDHGTFGELVIDGKKYFTAELPDRDNKERFSRILPGEYLCKWEWSNRFKRFMYELKNVPGRTEVKIHSGNFAGDTTKGYRCEIQGCILLGRSVGTLGTQKVLGGSRLAVKDFELYLGKADFNLIILNERPDKTLT